jgi:hypothetical protein
MEGRSTYRALHGPAPGRAAPVRSLDPRAPWIAGAEGGPGQSEGVAMATTRRERSEGEIAILWRCCNIVIMSKVVGILRHRYTECSAVLNVFNNSRSKMTL